MTTELECQLASLRQGDHICRICESVAEQLDAAVPFMKEGLARGERCLYIADERSVEAIVGALAAAGVDVARKPFLSWVGASADGIIRAAPFGQ